MSLLKKFFDNFDDSFKSYLNYFGMSNIIETINKNQIHFEDTNSSNKGIIYVNNNYKSFYCINAAETIILNGFFKNDKPCDTWIIYEYNAPPHVVFKEIQKLKSYRYDISNKKHNALELLYFNNNSLTNIITRYPMLKDIKMNIKTKSCKGIIKYDMETKKYYIEYIFATDCELISQNKIKFYIYKHNSEFVVKIDGPAEYINSTDQEIKNAYLEAIILKNN